MRIGLVIRGLLLIVLAVSAATAQELRKAPAQYFNDYALLTSQTTRSELNSQLEQFERDTSSQIIVAIYPKLPEGVEIAEYTRQLAESWGVGQENTDNGTALFVFRDDRKMYLQVGYGLEGAIPDITAQQIITRVITPHFKRGDFEGGLRAGVAALLAAAQGEYQGTGRTVADAQSSGGGFPWIPLFFFLFILGVVISHLRSKKGTVYDRNGRSLTRWSGAPYLGGGGRRGGGFGGGGLGGGGGGGFSGGGGSFGGGGAGGSW